MVTLMISGRIGCELAVLAVVCVLTVFLFPSMHGPYSVVHGPATALLAVRAAARLQSAIVQAALRSPGRCLLSALAVLFRTPLSAADFHSFNVLDCNAILRC
jgi:hypothetical protein